MTCETMSRNETASTETEWSIEMSTLATSESDLPAAEVVGSPPAIDLVDDASRREETVNDSDRVVVEEASNGATQESVNLGELKVGPRENQDLRIVKYTAGSVQHRDRINTDSERSRRKFVKDVAAKLACDATELDHLDAQILNKADEADRAAIEAAEAQARAETWDAIAEQKLEETDKDTKEAAERFLKSPRLFEELACDFAELGIVGEILLATVIYLVAVSRLLGKPLHASIQAPSSSGKSHAANSVMELMPRECVVKATQFTPNSLFYMPSGALEHRLVYAAERRHSSPKGAAAANEGLALREMLSSGEIRKKVTVQGETVTVHQKGPIAYLDTTTQLELLDEDANRLLRLEADGSAQQTERILEEKAKRAAGKGPDPKRLDSIRRKHQTAQRLLSLDPHPVVIPFAELLRIPSDKPLARRAFDHLLSCIQAVALLRQRRKKVINGVIHATPKDYDVVYELMVPILRQTLGSVNQRSLDLAKQIKRQADGSTFNMKDIEKWSGLPRTTINDRLKPIREAGLIVVVDTGDRRTKTFQMTTPITDTSLGLESLITPSELRQAGDWEGQTVMRRGEKPRPK